MALCCRLSQLTSGGASMWSGVAPPQLMIAAAVALQLPASPATEHIDLRVLLQVGEEQLARLAAQVQQQATAQADLRASLDEQLRQVSKIFHQIAFWVHRVCVSLWFTCWV